MSMDTCTIRHIGLRDSIYECKFFIFCCLVFSFPFAGLLVFPLCIEWTLGLCENCMVHTSSSTHCLKVGLLTGDVQLKTSSPCLIMTTEILRSMLYKVYITFVAMGNVSSIYELIPFSSMQHAGR